MPDFERLRVWADSQGIALQDKQDLIADRRVFEFVKAEVTRVTRELADYEKVKRVALLPAEFTIEGGELTPTLKVRRRIVEEKYQDLIESLYSGND